MIEHINLHSCISQYSSTGVNVFIYSPTMCKDGNDSLNFACACSFVSNLLFTKNSLWQSGQPQTPSNIFLGFCKKVVMCFLHKNSVRISLPLNSPTNSNGISLSVILSFIVYVSKTKLQ